eukprot:m.228941 g.228941  ORF g.228941 m.228941 type:complete len:53 (+) comp15198_c0_seq1:465-623(+)
MHATTGTIRLKDVKNYKVNTNEQSATIDNNFQTNSEQQAVSKTVNSQQLAKG